MALFYFDTGVRPSSGSKLYGCQVWRNGTKQIPFNCDDVPDGAEFLFASDNDQSASLNNAIVREIKDACAKGGLVSKYAYFKVKGVQ